MVSGGRRGSQRRGARGAGRRRATCGQNLRRLQGTSPIPAGTVCTALATTATAPYARLKRAVRMCSRVAQRTKVAADMALLDRKIKQCKE